MHNVYNFDNKKYNFYDMILNYYTGVFDNKLTNLENIHKILNTDNISDNDRKFYQQIPEFGITDRNSIFVKKFYTYFDTDYTFLKLYLDFVINNIKPLFPDESKLVIQKVPNIRFHIPGNSNIGRKSSDKFDDIIGLHHDGEFGHPQEEYNIVIPITEMYDTNAMYYEENPKSELDPHMYKNMKLNQHEFYMGNLNQCKHYNKINETTITRVSLDIRVIPYSQFKPGLERSATSKIKFELGNYYMLI